METINLTLKIPNQNDLNLLLKLVQRLGIETINIQSNPHQKRLGASKSNGKAMASALRKLAKTRSMNKIENPMEWQREIRKDNPLFGRK